MGKLQLYGLRLTRAARAHILPVANLKTGERIMKRIAALLGLVIVSAVLAQSQAVQPFKLGTFQAQNRTFVGIVLRDSVVVDFAAASRAITPSSNVSLPTDMKDLIARYDSGLRDRIVQVVRSVNAQTAARPAYVYDLT